jgi:predicted ATP-dependent serine protease
MKKKEEYIPKYLPTNMEKIKIPKNLLQPMETGTNLDMLFSIHKGIMTGVNIMIHGPGGVGKSTVLLDMISKLQAKGKRVAFVSAEMNERDVMKFNERFPEFKKIPVYFPSELPEGVNPVEYFLDIFNVGYDVVLIDSIVEVTDWIVDSFNTTPKKAVNILLDIIEEQNLGHNSKKINTTFLLIQQETKGGQFVGSNRLKHMTQATMEVKFDDPIAKTTRYITFSKNRDGVIGERVDFQIKAKDDDIKENIVVYESPSFHIIEKKKPGRPASQKEEHEGGLDIEELLPLDKKDNKIISIHIKE